MRDSAAPREQRPDVAARLGALQLPERDAQLGYGRVCGVVDREHEKQAGVGAALVELSGGVEVAGPEPEGRGAAEGAPPGRADRLELGRDVGSGR